jgi:hypothetical protein
MIYEKQVTKDCPKKSCFGELKLCKEGEYSTYVCDTCASEYMMDEKGIGIEK